MSQLRRVFLPAIMLLLMFTTSCLASAQNPQRVIKEGVGWEHFTLGATAKSLIDTFGSPGKQGRMLKWDEAGLNCLLNDKQEAIELRFEKRFKGVTESGVTFGMSADKVRKIYGDAGQMELRGEGMKLIWPSRGILIWFHNNAVYQIVVFKPHVIALALPVTAQAGAELPDRPDYPLKVKVVSSSGFTQRFYQYRDVSMPGRTSRRICTGGWPAGAPGAYAMELAGFVKCTEYPGGAAETVLVSSTRLIADANVIVSGRTYSLTCNKNCYVPAEAVFYYGHWKNKQHTKIGLLFDDQREVIFNVK